MIKRLLLISFMILANQFVCISQIEESADNDANGDEQLLDSLKSLMDEYNQKCFKIEVSFNGYESGSDESWYYDSLGVICGYHINWDMEGQSGEEFNWFENGKLSALYQETQGGDNEPDIVFLKSPEDSDNLKSHDVEISGQEQRVFSAINDNQDKIDDDGSIFTITIEETVNYGGEYTQTTKIYIDKELYELLFKEK